MLKPPGTKHLKLKCDELLSSFAFKFKLRRYNMAMNHIGGKLLLFQSTLPSVGAGRLLNRGDDHRSAGTDKVRRCRANLSNPSRKGLGLCVLKLQYDEPLSKFAFNFNLRRYNKEHLLRSPADPFYKKMAAECSR